MNTQPHSNNQTQNAPSVSDQPQSQAPAQQPPYQVPQSHAPISNQSAQYNQGQVSQQPQQNVQYDQGQQQSQQYQNRNFRSNKPWRNQGQANMTNQSHQGNNGIFQVSNKFEQPQKDLNIKGIAIFNNTVVDYFCDAGAVRSIISADLFEKIRHDSPGTKLEPYKDKPLRSVNSDLKIVGSIRLDRCLMSAELQLRNAVLLVAQDLTGPSCILGRDWAAEIPKLSRVLKNIEKTVQEMSASIREKIKEFPTIVKAVQEGSNICLSAQENRKESRPGDLIYSVKPETGNTNVDGLIASVGIEENEEDPKILVSRAFLEPKLRSGTAKSMTELTPRKNFDKASRIELIDPSHPPISYKSRSLPFHLKKKVKQALDEQENAGIIRKSTSNWTSALRVVHKQDFSIRITVDFKPLNKIIKIDEYPLPSVADLYAKLGQAKFFQKWT